MCYQLQQKRRLLSELKAELEYCRKKWALARALNNESEEQCKQLRHEFSMRKVQDQNSAESGYSDEHPSDIDGDDEAAGPSQRIPKVPNFDANLMMFDRTASPTNSERRRSESPMINDFSVLCLFSRAQSEPPRIRENSSNESDSNNFEILDLVTDPIEQPCVASSMKEPCHITESRLIVTPPPEVHDHSSKLKAHSRKHKKDKKRKSNDKKAESAEEMFLRLMKGGNSESSSCSSTSYEEDDFDMENIEEIQEIPLDESTVECCATILESSQEIASVEEPVEVINNIEPQPSTSAAKEDDISLLSVKEQEYLLRREERLQRLEAEAKAFYDKMARNKDKGVQLNNHINDIHNTFMVRNKDRTKSEDEKTSDEPEPSTSGESAKKTDESCEHDVEQKDDEK